MLHQIWGNLLTNSFLHDTNTRKYYRSRFGGISYQNGTTMQH